MVRDGEEPQYASHLVSPRALYTHHGIYVGSGRVIHYSGFSRGVRRGPVEETSLEQFAQGHAIHIRRDTRLYFHGEIIARARSRLGENCYRLWTNNCEHFCTWVLRGERSSRQVDRLGAFPRVLLLLLRNCYLRIARHQRAIQASGRH
jgi:hypothetical protein